MKIEVLHCLVENMHICIDLQYINKTVLLPALEPMPMSPNYVAGLMNVAGNGVTVIDLALRAGMKRHQSYSLSTPVLLGCGQLSGLGLLVDSVLGLATVSKNSLQKSDEYGSQNSIFLGTFLIDRNLSFYINTGNLMCHDK